MHITILAAGKGTRMNSSKPKVMHKIGGKMMIERVVALAGELAGTQTNSKITIVIAEYMQELREFAAAHGCNIAVQKQQLGTGHAVLQAATGGDARCDDDILVLYGDTPFISVKSAKALLQKTQDAAVAVLGFSPTDAGKYGRLIVDAAGNLQKIVEYKDASEQEKAVNLCNSGVMAISSHAAHLLRQITNDNSAGEYYLTDMVGMAIGNGLQAGFVLADTDEVMGVNSMQELAMAENTLQWKTRDRLLTAGVNLIAPETCFIADDVVVGRDVVIHPFVVIGAGSVIGDGVEVKSFSHIEKALVRDGAIIGPYARLRPQADIGENAHIGNFVEIKNSVIAAGAKVNHLSYVGDASVGVNSNIGAGVITCNYDGFNKYRTNIGADCFIGSNTIIVAPCNIGNNVVTGAGAVITKDVAADALFYNRKDDMVRDGGGAAYKKARKDGGAGA